MTARAIRLELRRGPGLLLVAVIAAVGPVLILLSLAAGGPRLEWSMSGPGMVPWLNSTALLLGPLVTAAGVWASSREHRLGVEELVAVVSRPRWQRDTAGFAALTVAAWAGLLVLVAVTVAVAAGGLSYPGGRWPLSLLLVALGYAAWLALGLAVGRLLPFRWTAPLAGLICYLVEGIPAFVRTTAAQLTPLGNLPGAEGWRLRPGIALLGAGWLLALTAAALIAGAARRRSWALLPSAVAVVIAIPLVGQPMRLIGDDYVAGWAAVDPVANEQVCTGEAPKVCVRRVHAALLPEVASVTRTAVPLVTDFVLIEEAPVETPGVRPTVVPGELDVIPSLAGRAQPFSGALREPGTLAQTVRERLAGAVWCPQPTPAMDRAYVVADALVRGRSVPRVKDGAAWLRDYLRAGQSCDMAAIERLARP
jgi:hypothetical protein